MDISHAPGLNKSADSKVDGADDGFVSFLQRLEVAPTTPCANHEATEPVEVDSPRGQSTGSPSTPAESFELVEQGPMESAVEDVPVSSAAYRSVLFDAQLSTLQGTSLKLPWETGIMQTIFSNDDMVWPTVPHLDPSCAAIPPT